MTGTQLGERIVTAGLVAVVRRVPADRVEPVARTLMRGGVVAAEITWDDEGSPDLLTRALAVSGGGMLWGLGTITDARQVARGVAAGAQFIVTPVLLPEVISACRELGVLCMPGAFSPTEVYSAWAAGGDLIKVFPACVVGPEYFRELLGPFPQLPLVAVGGIDATNAGSFLRAGACAVAAGGRLIPRHLVEQGDWTALQEHVSRFVAAVGEGRGSCSH